VRWRLRVWRRRACRWLGHPGREEVVLWHAEPAVLLDDGTVRDGAETVVKAWRCVRHDR
jgi:hypothetical protein